MPIEVNDAFLSQAADINMQLAGDTPAAPNGSIENMIIRPGHANFVIGQAVGAVIRANGSGVKQRLVEIGQTAGLRATQLRAFIAMTDGAEGLDEMTARDFQTRIPAFGTPGGAK